ncbi:MAG: NADPH-dependent glutamate synthase [Dehalococcoidia bacterium]|nr:NADPH-dependent glutamate synthase [Dehalococcoidia bacterium]
MAEKLKLNRIDMPKQEPAVRAKNFGEVATGFTAEMAKEEASRCIQCAKRNCVAGCPVNVDIPDFIAALRTGNMPLATHSLKAKNALPGVCGRVCPQESQCEKVCTLAKKGAAIGIGRLERYVADWALKEGFKEDTKMAKPTGLKVAVVGTGPAGLTAAADLAKGGHSVTMFEALHVAGGVLMYGIPEFRLPKQIVQSEVNFVKSLGVEIKLDWVVGRTLTVDELQADGYKAIFLGTGAGLPMFMHIPGENLGGVYSANEFLTRINLMKAYLFPQYRTPVIVGEVVAVVGAGNVAMDAARCALRLGAKKVYIVYRRSRAEMPARHEELENAEEEGIIFKLLTNPVKFTGNDKGQVTGMTCVEMELGEPDASGRRRPVEKKGSEFAIDVNTVVIALGTVPNPLVPSTTEGLNVTEHGTVTTDAVTGLTSKKAVWAGGDVATGAATVISAMGAGKRAAAAMNKYLANGA